MDFPALNPVSPASLDYLCGINSVVILSPSSSLTNETSFNVTVRMLRTNSSLCGYRHRSAIFIAHQPHDLLVLENQDFQEVFPYFQGEKEMVFLGAPYIEYGAFDPACGDVYFIQVY
ncbi:TPA: hypothetical protein SAO36_003498 [Salmonella enterica]|nr:hypothetical protein [Salmonella enterica]